MKVEIFDANKKLDFEKKMNNFLQKGNIVSKVKFEIRNEKIKLIVYYTASTDFQQKAIIVKSPGGIKGSISIINRELESIPNIEDICMDTVLYDVNGLMAIIIKKN